MKKKRRSKKRNIKTVMDEKASDSLMNVVSGFGTNRDKKTHNKFTHAAMNKQDEYEAMYLDNWLIRKIVDLAPRDMTKNWRRFKGDEVDPKILEEFAKYDKKMKIKGKAREALQWARLYGGCAIFPIIDGANNLWKEFNINEVRKGSLKALTVIDSDFIFPSSAVCYDPTSPYYLLPEFYTLAGSSSKVHRSRLIFFYGDDVPRREKPVVKWWGQSIVKTLYDSVSNAMTASGGLASLFQEANVDILSVKGLSQSIVAGMGDDIKARYETYDYLKSLFNLVVIDSEEQYSNRTIQMSGMDKVLEKFLDIVAGASGYPVTKLMGSYARGLNANGESEEKKYYGEVRGQQEAKLEEPLMQLDDIMQMSLFGEIKEGLTFEFNEIYEEPLSDKATREASNAQRDIVYLDKGIMREDQILKQLKQDKVYDNITDEDILKMEKWVKESEDEDDFNDDPEGDKDPKKEGE